MTSGKNLEPDGEALMIGEELADEESQADFEVDPLDLAEQPLHNLAKGRALIAERLSNAPTSPGVYRMLAADGAVLYVGKAKNIKKRLSSYAQGRTHSVRIDRMVAQTHGLEFITTITEAEALLLEANLIKQLKPRFNVLLRDDKSFPYIFISGDHDAPQIMRHRGGRQRKGRYYGPFASGTAVMHTVTMLQKIFLLRSCSDAVYDSRTRPCLLHQIKRCAAPCTGEISLGGYGALVRQADDFLNGKSASVRAQLAAEMEAAAEKLDFETAARLRDRLAAMAAVLGQQGVNPRGVDEADVFALVQEGGQWCIEVFFFRMGQNWGNRAYFPRADALTPPEEVLDSFLAQFYLTRPPPRLLLLSYDLPSAPVLIEALQERYGLKTSLHTPQRGEKRSLVEDAARNAREALGRKLAESSAQGKLLASLQTMLGLSQPIERIEIYDNSHIQGSHAIGAMVVAGVEGFERKAYRTFNIKSTELTPGDDFAMMREVLERRFKRFVKEQEAVQPLVIIDGGVGQFSAAEAVLEACGLSHLPLISLAKGVDRNAGREMIHVRGREPFRLDPRDPVLYFLQRLRDEAHRFAIGTHRKKRSRDIERSSLDEIAGIGASRKRALLHYFGTSKAVAGASLDDLMAVSGIDAKTAQNIFDYFRD